MPFAKLSDREIRALRNLGFEDKDKFKPNEYFTKEFEINGDPAYVYYYYKYHNFDKSEVYTLSYRLLFGYTAKRKDVLAELREEAKILNKAGLKVDNLRWIYKGSIILDINLNKPKEEQDNRVNKTILRAGYKYDIDNGFYYRDVKKDLNKFDSEGGFLGEDFTYIIKRIKGKDYLSFTSKNYIYTYESKEFYLNRENSRLWNDFGIIVYNRLRKPKSENKKEESNSYRDRKEESHSYRSYEDFFRDFFGGRGRSNYNNNSYSSRSYNTEWWKVLEFTSIPISFDIVKKRYRDLIRKYHPDIAGKNGEEKSKKINLAYEEAKKYFRV